MSDDHLCWFLIISILINAILLVALYHQAYPDDIEAVKYLTRSYLSSGY